LHPRHTISPTPKRPYAFGSAVKERTASFTIKYRYGFNNQEQETELGDYYSFEYRVHDARLGRFLSVDPHYYSYFQISTYSFCNGSPVMFIDPDGRDIIYGMGWNSSKAKLAYEIIRSMRIAYFEAAIAPFENNPNLNLRFNIQSTTENEGFKKGNSNAYTEVDPIMINGRPVNAFDRSRYQFTSQTINICSDPENIREEYNETYTKIAKMQGVLNSNQYYAVKYYPKEIDMFLNLAHEILHAELNSKPIETRGCLDNNCQHATIASQKQKGIFELLSRANEIRGWGLDQIQLESASWYGLQFGENIINIENNHGFGNEFNNDFLEFATSQINQSLQSSGSSYRVDLKWWEKDANSVEYMHGKEKFETFLRGLRDMQEQVMFDKKTVKITKNTDGTKTESITD
jgi:RHS repeat-associated protein